MADENRLSQIKEGAGLEESRLNTDFIEFVRKWSTPVLIVLAVLSLGYFFWNKQKEARAARIDEAFEQLNQSTEASNPSPDALRRIAEDYKDVAGVRMLARLAAADEYLRAVKRGVKPGSVLNADGEAENAEDVLTEEDRARFLAEAEGLYKQVYESSAEKAPLALHTLSALYGLAAVAESRVDRIAAKNLLDQAHNLAIRHGFAEHAVITQKRLDTLPRLATPVTLYHKADLPEIPALKTPEIAEDLIQPGDEVLGPTLPEAAPAGEEEKPDQPEGGPGDEKSSGEGGSADDGGR